MAEILSGDSERALERASSVLAAGRLVAIPTETVYGLAADATNGEAVARIFAAKGRPRLNPLIAHVCDLAMAEKIGMFDDMSRALAGHFWPGPLTLVVPLRKDSRIHPLVTAGLDTIALRMPRGLAVDVITRLGRPLAAPSANLSGRLSATTAQDVNDDLSARVALIIDAGQCDIGLESTIVKIEEGRARLLRPGGVPVEAIEALGIQVVRTTPGTAVEAPGMLVSHYAPRAAVRPNAHDVREGEALLTYGSAKIAGSDKAIATLNLSLSGDLVEAAANLFSCLHKLDASGAQTIAIALIPDEGLGEAINDRLSRAAAARNLEAMRS